MWSDPTQHIYAVGEVVTAATLNTYVQANLASLAAYSSATRYYADAVGGSATAETVYATHLGIVTFAEQFTMEVKVMGRLNVTNAVTATVYVQDETGAHIPIGPPYGAVVPLNGTSPISFIGKKNYNANASAGFKLAYSLSSGAGTVSIASDTEVTFIRGWV